MKSILKKYFISGIFVSNKTDTKEHSNRQNVNTCIRHLTLTKRDSKQLNVFERKVYRRILDPVWGKQKEKWRILTNKEIYAIVNKKNPTITQTIRLHRLCWFGHVQRMKENTIPKYLSIRFYNSCRRLPQTKRHSSLFLH
jgi:hypothetical protein